MRLRLSREQIATVARRWNSQYEGGTADKVEIGRKLAALDPAKATAAEVAAIIGNKSWSHFTCQECSQPVEQAVDLKGEYDTSECLFCPSCLRAAAALASVVLP